MCVCVCVWSLRAIDRIVGVGVRGCGGLTRGSPKERMTFAISESLRKPHLARSKACRAAAGGAGGVRLVLADAEAPGARGALRPATARKRSARKCPGSR